MSDIINDVNDEYNLKDKKEGGVNLIIVDLDGTILPNFKHLDQNVARVLRELKKRGHKICIATGRNYLSSISVYNEIGLNDFLITYNGSFINNPDIDDSKYLVSFSISNSVIRDILSSSIIFDNLINLMVDSEKRVSVTTSDDSYYREVFFNGNEYLKKDNYFDILSFLGNSDCLQLVLEFENNEDNINKIVSFLRKKFRNSVSFYYGEKLKEEIGSSGNEEEKILIPDSSKIIFKIRSSNASKGKAAEIIANYYNIPLSDSIAFGNDVNDIEMMLTVGEGVAMSDSMNNLKLFASDITEFGSKKGAVFHYLRKKFKIDIDF